MAFFPPGMSDLPMFLGYTPGSDRAATSMLTIVSTDRIAAKAVPTPRQLLLHCCRFHKKSPGGARRTVIYCFGGPSNGAVWY